MCVACSVHTSETVCSSESLGPLGLLPMWTLSQNAWKPSSKRDPRLCMIWRQIKTNSGLHLGKLRIEKYDQVGLKDCWPS